MESDQDEKNKSTDDTKSKSIIREDGISIKFNPGIEIGFKPQESVADQTKESTQEINILNKSVPDEEHSAPDEEQSTDTDDKKSTKENMGSTHISLGVSRLSNPPEPVFYDTLVLSGGAIRGILTIGALQYAYDNFLFKNVKTYIGTSSGAIIGFFLAIGYTPIEIMVYICTKQVMERMQNFNVVAMIQGKGACSYSTMGEELEKMTIAKIGYLPTLLDLYEKYGKTFVCATHNFTKDKTEYLSWETHPQLPCLTALRMTSNLPFIFEMFYYGKDLYIDGGVSDNFPIDIAKKYGEKILGIAIIDLNREINSEDPDIGTLQYIYQLMFIPISQIIKNKIRMIADRHKIIVLKHEKKIFSFNMDSHEKLEMFSSGYSKMKESMEA